MISSPFTRRRFLSASGVLIGSGIIAHAIPLSATNRRLSPNAFLPDAPHDALLRQLATVAVDAARDAGAEFADVRVGVQRSVAVLGSWPPTVRIEVGYGIRALVQGTWSFQRGNILTSDAIANAARGAAAGAAAYAVTNARLAHSQPVTLAPAPVVTGEWRGPMEIDPFTVPLDDYYRAFLPITDLSASIHRNTKIGGSGVSWNAETRVFASTEGSLVTQHFMRGGLSASGSATLPENRNDLVMVDVPGLDVQSAGFEAVLRTDWIDHILPGMEDAIRLREIPRRKFQDVGRFPVVFEGNAFATVVGQTVSAALDGDRASGIEADASGGTFLSPPDIFLDASAPTFSPLLSMTSDMALPSALAVGWDDEGVAPVSATLIEEGRVLDYHTTRETAPLFASYYEHHGKPIRSQGRAMAMTPSSLPVCSAGDVSVAPSKSVMNAADWQHEMTNGFVIRELYSPQMEPQLSAGTLGAGGNGVVLHIKNGKPVARTVINLQFGTKTLFKDKLVALGDASTVRTASTSISKGMPWQGVAQQVSAPAAFCKDVDVFSWDVNG